MSQDEIIDTEIAENEPVKREDALDASSMEVKNPRIGKVLKLQEEVQRQNELEALRSRRIRQEQEYIDKMSASVEENLRNTREEQRYNKEFEAHIKYEVYRMHGISEDKLQGMNEYRNAWYQGAAFALFFLSLVLIALCGVLHGFGSDICIFMAFYTAIEGALLSNGRKQSVILEGVIRVLYLLLFPLMMVIFVCYELGFSEYRLLVPIFTIAGTVVLMIGAVSYFLYDPYRLDRRNRKKADRYMREMEKTALKEVRLKEKAFGKFEKKKEKQEVKEEKKQKRKAIHHEKKERRAAWWHERKAAIKSARHKEEVPGADAEEARAYQKDEGGTEKGEEKPGAEVPEAETPLPEAKEGEVQDRETRSDSPGQEQ